jgi:L-cysteine:1D-myo-inositol 2-amino-2-deoxy-alpha-D-glucopyranoside ligase
MRERHVLDSVQCLPSAPQNRERPLLEPLPHDNLHLYDTRRREKVRFEPLLEREVTMYVCGITPYDVGHLGHALTYVVFDTLRRWFEFNAYEVRHIQNITDIDDDMVRVSKRLGISIADLTDRNQEIYLREMDALNLIRPDAFPRVSETIPEIIEMVSALIERGCAYETEGYVFVDTTQMPEFGVLAGMSREELRSFSNDSMPEEPEHLKRDSLDFLVWQPCADEGATFESPWGPGRPGWHIECSAMARANLGDRIDIHGGGRDLRYPHHDSEIVQSECATGAAPYVGFWMHNGTMQLGGEKMSKSKGNLVRVSELLEQGFTPNGLRLALLAIHYREDRDFEEAALRGWEEQARLLERAVDAPGGPPDQLRVQAYRNAFQSAMDDDLDTPTAIEVLLDVARGVEDGRIAAETGIPTLVELGDVLGLRLRRE